MQYFDTKSTVFKRGVSLFFYISVKKLFLTFFPILAYISLSVIDNMVSFYMDAHILFINNAATARYSSPELLSKIKIKILRLNSRPRGIFHIPRCRTNFYSTSTIMRGCKMVNGLLCDFPNLDFLEPKARKALETVLKSLT